LLERGYRDRKHAYKPHDRSYHNRVILYLHLHSYARLQPTNYMGMGIRMDLLVKHSVDVINLLNQWEMEQCKKSLGLNSTAFIQRKPLSFWQSLVQLP